MRFTRETAVAVAIGWLVAACCYGPAHAVPSKSSEEPSFPIEDIYDFNGPESGIKVHHRNLLSVNGFSVNRFPEPDTARNHYKPRGIVNSVKFLVMHITDNTDLENTLKLFTTNSTNNQTSAHYVVAKPTEADTDQMLIRVVPEDHIAYHAGESSWGYYKNLDSISIGIDIVNMGHRRFYNWDEFHPEQIQIVGLLLARLCQQYDITPHNVVAHADIAPHRRYDPGVMFPWGYLYTNYGVGAWLDQEDMIEEVLASRYKPCNTLPRYPRRQVFLKYLAAYGYDVSDGDAAIKAFKAHFSANTEPALYNTHISPNDMYWAWALVTKYRDTVIYP